MSCAESAANQEGVEDVYSEVESDSDGESEEEDEDEDTDEEDESTTGEEDEEGEEEGKEVEDKQEESAPVSESDSGGEECEKCPICLIKLKHQDIGTPEGCDHCFCLECIQAWAQNTNTCPMDRQVFTIILARHGGEDKIFKQIPVANQQQQEEEVEDEDPTFCEVCEASNREDRLLLCDGCDLGYHCDCLNPPLATVPVDEWFCPDCQAVRDQAEMITPREHRRQIARTLVSERVRQVIADARIERAFHQERIELERQEVARRVALEMMEDDASRPPRPSTSGTRRATTTPRKKKKTKKRKTTKGKGKGKRRKGKKKENIKIINKLLGNPCSAGAHS